MDGLTSHRNDCLSDKFNRRFLEMMWSHTHILARLPVYHLKCWQIATINPKRKRTLTSEVATVVRDGESIQMKLQLTLEQHRFELRGSMQIFFNKHSRPPPVLHPWIQHTADRKQYFRIPNRRFPTADSGEMKGPLWSQKSYADFWLPRLVPQRCSRATRTPEIQ